MRHLLLLAMLIPPMACGVAVGAATLPSPSGPVLLTVTGGIGVTNAGATAVFDRAMLEELGFTTLATSTPWTDGVPEFQGVLVSKILDVVHAEGTSIHAVAANDYAIDLDIAELRKYPILAAMKQDGHELHLRDRGPIWIVYPRDDVPALQSEANNYKWIWQLQKFEVR